MFFGVWIRFLSLAISNFFFIILFSKLGYSKSDFKRYQCVFLGSLENCFAGLEYLRLDIFSIEVDLIDSSRKMHSQYCSIC